MICRAASVAMTAFVLLFTAGDATAQSQSTAFRESVLKFVRAYVGANNSADANAVMDMTSRQPTVSSVSLGEITRGWEAIRADADSLAGSEGMYKLSIGTADVTPLGASAALVVASVTLTFATQEGPAQVRGAMTLVLEKSDGAWKMLHEHYSIPLPGS